MKTPIALLFALALAELTSAADITLSDGRVYRDAAVVSVSAGRVCLRHPGGLVQVDKALLTGDLAERYPADAAAAEREDLKLLEEAKLKSGRDAEGAERIRTARRSPSHDVTVVDRSTEYIKEAARAYAERYFERNQPGTTNSWTFTHDCEISEPESRPGWIDQWRVSGDIYTRSMSSQGGISSPAYRFEAIVEKKGGAYVVIDFTKR